MEKTFKDTILDGKIEKEIRKTGTSLGILFSREELKLFNLEYGDKINLNDAIIIKKDKKE